MIIEFKICEIVASIHESLTEKKEADYRILKIAKQYR